MPGDQDLQAPPWVMRRQLAHIPGAQFIVLPEASHSIDKTCRRPSTAMSSSASASISQQRNQEGDSVSLKGPLFRSRPFMPDHTANRRLLATRHYRTLRRGAFTRTKALLEKLSLHGIACEVERRSEVLAGDFVSPAVKFDFAERGVVERDSREAIAVGDGANLFEPAFRGLRVARWRWRGSTQRPGKDASSSTCCKAKRSFPSQCPRCDGPSHEPTRWRPRRDIRLAGARCREIEESLSFGHKP